MEFGLELRRSRRRAAERIDLDGEVAIALNGPHECRGASGGSQQTRVHLCRGRAASQLTRGAEILAPGLVYRSGVASVVLVHLRDVPVVKDAGNRKIAHEIDNLARPAASVTPRRAGGRG